jgi:hypothetical protein
LRWMMDETDVENGERTSRGATVRSAVTRMKVRFPNLSSRGVLRAAPAPPR